MPQKTNEVRLECTTGGHNKQYTLWLEEPKSGLWIVNFHYGAIGNSPLQGTKTPSPVSRSQADTIYQRLMQEKLAKGYVKTGSSGPSYTNVPAKKTASKGTWASQLLPPMLLTAGDVTLLDKYIKSDEWVAQQKMNGKRIVVEISKNKIVGYNRKCIECPIPKSVSDQLEGCEDSLLDGEMVGDVYHVFDALVLEGKPIVKDSYTTRCDKLTDFFDSGSFGGVVKRLPHSFGEDEKAKLVAKLRKNNEEGVVFKHIGAAYTTGKTDSINHATAVKVKFYREDSFQVLHWTTGKSSISVGAYDGNGVLVCVGNVTVPAKYTSQITSGRAVRVRYLYATKANQLYQPVLCPDEDGCVMQDDVDVSECLISKLKYEGKSDTPEKDIGRNIIV